MSFDATYQTEQIIKWLTAGLRSGKLRHKAVFDDRGGIKAVTILLTDDDGETRQPVETETKEQPE